MSDLSILTTDGTNFKPSDREVKFICTNESIDSFLYGGKDSSINIITGQKGSGKSILISYKSYLDRKLDKDNKFFIPEKGTEKIGFSDELSASELEKHVKYQQWEKIFNVSLYYFILSRLYDQLIDYEIITEEKYKKIQFHDIFNPLELDPTKIKYGSILYKCINNRAIIYSKNSTFIDTVKHILSIYISKREVSVYLDNLDQALFSSLINENPNHLSNSGLNKQQIDLENFLNSDSSFLAADRTVLCWLNCHIGFFLSLYNINSLDRRLNIYTTFRLEAYQYFNYLRIKNSPQLRSIVMKIEYSENDFEMIYQNLLKAANIDESALKLASIDHLPHLYVKNKIRNSESLWNFIKRHTFLNPREITFQVNVLKDLIYVHYKSTKSKEELQNAFKEAISEKALSKIFGDLQAETLPFFPENELMQFYARNGKNYIKDTHLLSTDKNLLTILYRLGLVGVVEYKRGSYYQKFLNKNIYFANEELSLPKTNYYLFHPTLDHILLTNHANSQFYYPNCIIGNGLAFEFLRDKNFYMPKSLKEGAEKQFDLFYSLENVYEKYLAIETSIYNTWAPKIWDHFYYNNKKGWIKDLKQVVNGSKSFHNLRKTNSPDNIKSLFRNYKLRIVLNISGILDLISDHRVLVDEVFFNGKFPSTTYFLNVRGTGNKQLRYMEFLSEFELKIVEKVINGDMFSEELKSTLRKNKNLKNEFESRVAKIRNRLQSYKD